MSTARTTHYRELVSLLQANTGSRRLSAVFDDFVHLAAIAFRNAADRRGRAAREAEYLEVAAGYTREELERFANALALIVLEMEAEPSDVLGRLYMELDLGSSHLGQFFTPYSVASLVAGMTIDPLVDAIQLNGFVTLHEPACGAGAFLVAVTQVLRSAGWNYQQQLLAEAEDLSIVAVHMAYLHLSLLHVPALVHHRDTLTQETFATWPTPAYILGGWSTRRAARRFPDLERARLAG